MKPSQSERPPIRRSTSEAANLLLFFAFFPFAGFAFLGLLDLAPHNFRLGGTGLGRPLGSRLHNLDDMLDLYNDCFGIVLDDGIGRQFQLADVDRLLNLQVGDVDGDIIGNRDRQALDRHAVQVEVENSACEQSASGPFQHDGNFDFDAIIGVNPQKVDVVDFRAEGVPLNVAEHRFFDIAFDVEIDHAGARLEDRRQRIPGDFDGKRIDLVAVDDSGDFSRTSQPTAGRRAFHRAFGNRQFHFDRHRIRLKSLVFGETDKNSDSRRGLQPVPIDARIFGARCWDASRLPLRAAGSFFATWARRVDFNTSQAPRLAPVSMYS